MSKRKYGKYESDVEFKVGLMDRAKAYKVFVDANAKVCAGFVGNPITAEVNEPVDHQGVTALAVAAQLGDMDLALSLVGLGADPNKHGRFTPIDLALREGHFNMAQMLLDSGASVEKDSIGGGSLTYHAACDHRLAVKWLLDNGASVNARSLIGRTALHCACTWGYAEVAAMLIAHGAIVNDGCSDYTPLALAARGGSVETTQLLLENGADPNGVGREGVTPLGHARGDAVKELLLENGATELPAESIPKIK